MPWLEKLTQQDKVARQSNACKAELLKEIGRLISEMSEHAQLQPKPLSQRCLAKQSGFSQSTWRRICAGSVDPAEYLPRVRKAHAELVPR